MKIIVTTMQYPFTYGGAEILAKNLVEQLKQVGHTVELMQIPCSFKNARSAFNEREACKLLDLSYYGGNTSDLTICLKYPSYFVQHPNKKLWLLHQQRELYDLWPEYGKYYDLHQIDEKVRQELIKEDKAELKKFENIYTISKNVTKRLQSFSDVYSTPLYHPPAGYKNFYCNEPENYLLFPGRISHLKRHKDIIDAFSRTSGRYKLVIMGKEDNPEILRQLKAQIEKLKIKDRVHFTGFVSLNEKYKLFASCTAVVFPPKDEDYGYGALEAMYASKPILTCTDSGGPLEFTDQDCGYITRPTTETLREAFELIIADKKKSIQKGKDFLQKSKSMNISWQYVIENLLN